MTNTCATCRYYKATERADSMYDGHCKRYPPVMSGQTARWPMMLEDEWCGEWAGVKPKEEILEDLISGRRSAHD